MATRTTREITLPPEIVALVFSFKPEEDHWEKGEPPIYFICRSQGRIGLTTVTRSARDSPRVVARPPDTPFAAPCIAYSRVDVFQGLEELYAMGGRMRELACMFGTRLRWTPPHLRADDPGQTL